MRAPSRVLLPLPPLLVVVLVVVLGGVCRIGDAQPSTEGEADVKPSTQQVLEQVLEQLEQAGSDVKAIAAVIQSAKEAGLSDEEMETARKAAQRVILGDYSKNKKTKEMAVQRLKETLVDNEATVADKRRALDDAERQGVSSQNSYLFAEYVRMVEDAEMWADRERELEAQLTFSDRLSEKMEGLEARDLVLASLVPGLIACLVAWRTCNKPTAASLEKELLAAEAKELAQKSKRGNSKAAVRLTTSLLTAAHCSYLVATG